MTDVWLGLDLGTQSGRALAVSASGELVGQGSRRLASRRDGPRHEQDPEAWWQALAASCRDAVRGLDPTSIRGAALCGTSGTILLVDADSGEPLTPGLMYDDTRAVAEACHVQEAGEELWAELGYRIPPTWALPKLVWLVQEHRDLLPRARLAHQPDLVTRRLVGREVPADTSHALKSGYDLLHDTWPREVLANLGVPEDLLPEVVLAGSRLGTVCAAAAADSGIPEGTPVVAGMTDGCAAQLGACALHVGSWNSVLGTTLVLKGVTPELLKDPNGVVYSHRSPDGGWLPGGASNTGAGVLTKEYPDRDLDELGARAAEREPASVVTYPLAGRGERFPFTAPEAEGFALGEPEDEADHFASLLQGVAFIERLCFDYLDLLGAPIGGELSFTGGGARSRYWSQLRADVLDRPVRLLDNAEGALGMAALAAASVRGMSAADAAAELVRVREVIAPRPDRVPRFRAPYLRLVDELERRGWLAPDVAHHARRRAAG